MAKKTASEAPVIGQGEIIGVFSLSSQTPISTNEDTSEKEDETPKTE
jgi:hypothetical protein